MLPTHKKRINPRKQVRVIQSKRLIVFPTFSRIKLWLSCLFSFHKLSSTAHLDRHNSVISLFSTICEHFQLEFGNIQSVCKEKRLLSVYDLNNMMYGNQPFWCHSLTSREALTLSLSEKTFSPASAILKRGWYEYGSKYAQQGLYREKKNRFRGRKSQYYYSYATIEHLWIFNLTVTKLFLF